MDIDKLHPTYLHHVDMKIAPMAQRDLHHSSAGQLMVVYIRTPNFEYQQGKIVGFGMP
jgi:hypothetical protein